MMTFALHLPRLGCWAYKKYQKIDRGIYVDSLVILTFYLSALLESEIPSGEKETTHNVSFNFQNWSQLIRDSKC